MVDELVVLGGEDTRTGADSDDADPDGVDPDDGSLTSWLPSVPS